MINDILKDAETRMKKSIVNLQHDLATVRTGRATPTILDGIKVNYYGSKVPLKQVANVAAPDPRLIVVQVFDKSAIHEVEKAINTSDLGLNPMTDGNLIRLPIPSLTEERRKTLVKLVHKIGEESKVAIRNIRRNDKDMIKEFEKEKEISEDESHDAIDKLQELTDQYIKEIDEKIKKKEEDVREE